MLTGKRAFEGGNAASVITAVMSTDPPPLASTQIVAPAALDHLIRTCLVKDPEERRQNIHDVLLELKWLAGASGQSAGIPVAAGAPRRRRVPLPAIGAGVFLLSTLALAWMHFREAPADLRVIRFTIDAPEKAPFAPTRLGAAQISPDGLRLAFVGGGRFFSGTKLWIRPLDSTAAQPLAGTEGAMYPFWSGRQPVSRLLRRRQTEEGSYRRQSSANHLRGAGWARWDLAWRCRRRHRVRRRQP